MATDTLRVTRSRTIYVGDGTNDFCPCVRLSSRDFIFAKRDSALHKKLSSHEVEATILLWSDSVEFSQLFKGLLG
jgi:hypothetical protein